MTDLFDSMPTELVKASEDICLWFAERNINKWALGGLQSREALQADGIGDAVQESHMQDEPSIDALIAEIDGITEYAYDDFKLVECLPKAKVIAILDKYRE